MRYLLFVSHGALAAGMTQALGMLVGEREDVRQVAFQDGMGLPAFKAEVEKVLIPMTAEDEIIVLADLVSGSPPDHHHGGHLREAGPSERPGHRRDEPAHGGHRHRGGGQPSGRHRFRHDGLRRRAGKTVQHRR